MYLNKNFKLKNPKEVEHFIKENEITLKLIKSIEKPLINKFPHSEFTLEVCNSLEWTDDKKLLINISVSEDMFFNGLLDNFNGIYKEIQPILDEYVSTIVLFPEIKNKNLNNVKMNSNSAINLMARTAYFNTYNNYELIKEITLRDIPRKQQKEEIIQYCNTHDIIDSWDIAEKLRLESDDVEEILEELTQEQIINEWE